jgi:hypothetical protein
MEQVNVQNDRSVSQWIEDHWVREGEKPSSDLIPKQIKVMIRQDGIELRSLIYSKWQDQIWTF